MAEFEDAICPDCGNFTAVCSSPDGVEGQYYLTQRVCYVTALRLATTRRIDRMYGKSTPGPDGSKMTDGVAVTVALHNDDSEDVLGLAQQGAEDALLTGGDAASGLQQPEEDQDPAAT